MIKVDLHIHTHYSGDSDITFEQLVERCQKLGLGAVAITDHGTADGALSMACQPAPFKIIVGEEVASSEGEIIGLFLKESIPNGLSPEETIRRIRAQEGLVCIPHPFDRYRSSAMKGATLERIAGQVDIIEVFNSRTIQMQNLKLPKEFAIRNKLLVGAGSDAHAIADIGRAYVTIPNFENLREFLQSMAQAQIYGKRPSMATYFRSLLRQIRKRFRRKH
ncbi:MAG: PHP domain-containing protein [Dehalococcoidia bacterium]|nr:PHP domain-containing protein [Dehalococcoidia bacterium]